MATSVPQLIQDRNIAALDPRSELSDKDIIAVHDEIRVHEEVIASLDAELQKLAREAHRLQTQKAHYLELISKCRGRITLARRAPDEILALIFEYCVASGWARAPLAVSQVCAKWRRASLSPRVWSYIHLTSDSLDPIGRTCLWLSRAMQSPLHVTVDVRSMDSPLLGAFDLLLDCTSQWQSFSLTTRFTQQASNILALCQRTAPNLRFMSISTSDIDSFDPIAGGGDELTGLREALHDPPGLHGLHILSNKVPTSVPTHVQDVSLEIGHFPEARLEVGSILETLAGLPALRNLTLTVSSNFANALSFPDDDVPPSPLEQLESLTLNAYPAFSELLRHIHTPSLRRLCIRSTDQPLNFPHEGAGAALRYFLRSSSPPIQSLELHDIDIPRDDFITCFAALPQLEHIRLHETEIPNDVVALLYGPAGLCPRLSRLDLRWCEQLSGHALVDLVKSRARKEDAKGPVSVPIEEITVINCALVEESDVLNLARMSLCSVVVRDLHDYCRPRGCCHNARYRLRMRLRHGAELTDEKGTRLNLILD